MTILCVPNLSKPDSAKAMAQAVAVLAAENVQLLAAEGFAPLFSGAGAAEKHIRFLPEKEAYEACDMVITFGGDGTMLHTARKIIQCQKPMLGVNIGRLGFLTLVEPDEMELLRRLPQKEYFVEDRTLLEVEFGEGMPVRDFALNDVVLFKQSAEKTISLDIYCDDIKVSAFRGDGMIFSTPTGSTAYSMSAGGPIVDAHLSGIVATQICAHIVHTPPMVFSGKRILRAVPQKEYNDDILISCDGMESRVLPPDGQVIIRQSASTVPLVQFYDSGQLKSIDKKLKGR